MPKKIILVRHGQTDFNIDHIMQGHLDTFLNSAGLKQTQKTAKLLMEEKIDFIYSSDLKRTHQTALIISKELNIPIILNPLLRERNFGELEGYKTPEAVKIHSGFSWDRGFNDPASSYLNIESGKDMRKRVKKIIQMLKSKHKDQVILLVSHGGLIRNFIDYFNLTDKVVDFDKTFSNAGINIFEKTDNGYILTTL